MQPRTALLIIDVQNDFISGSLALSRCSAKQDGAEVLPCINHMIENVPFDVIAYSQDWHTEDHSSFVDNVYKRPLAKYSPVIVFSKFSIQLIKQKTTIKKTKFENRKKVTLNYTTLLYTKRIRM